MCSTWWHDAIYDKIRYFRGQYHGITCVLFHNYARIKIDSYESFPLDKTLTLHNVIIFIKSVFNKDRIIIKITYCNIYS